MIQIMGFLMFFMTVHLVFSLHFVISAHYNVGDQVPIFVNKIGPLDNPSETYQYYDLPFCHPARVVQKKESLGEILNADRLANALYELKFRENKVGQILCEKKLSEDDVSKFRNAVINDFYFQMYYDDLPMWGFIGRVEDNSWNGDEKGLKYFLFKHVQFDVLYNSDQVIEIRAFSDPAHVVDITNNDEVTVQFTYSVSWNETFIPFKKRMDKYSRASLLPTPRQIHWFSFINSIVIIVLLMGLLVMMFLRHLKNDLKKFSGGDEEEDKEVGWKYIHGDVFRPPSQLHLFSAILGSGTQFLIVLVFLFIMAFLGILYPYNLGSLSTSVVVIYSLTFPAAGYCTAFFHCQFLRTGWEKSVLLTGILYLGPLFLTVFILNIVAMSFGATAALPLGTIVVILLLYTLVAMPLLALGGMIGQRFSSEFQAPSVTKRVAREIPSLTWYMKTPGQMFVGGLLPFSAIVLELHHLYASMWGYKIFTLSGILFITFIILVVLTAMLSVGMTYIQLSLEDHEWWWRSILRGGSTAIFMFGYCIYYYAKSDMNGSLQLLFFFGYNACLCYAFFLMLGTISFYISWIFVRHIYHAIKSE